jgi:AAA ATPase domain
MPDRSRCCGTESGAHSAHARLTGSQLISFCSEADVPTVKFGGRRTTTRQRRYLMIKSAEIQNFRGFASVELTGLTRVNVVVGDNGAGKTALLEALFLASATSAEVPLRFRAWRGVDAAVATGPPQEGYDSVFLDLFHGFRKDRVPTISLHGSDEDSRSVRIYYDSGEPTEVDPEGETAGAAC